MRQISAKRAAMQRRRAARARLSHGPVLCQRCEHAEAVDTHELTRRSQSATSADDPDQQVVLCRPCHVFVTEHPAEAVATGWARWSWQESADKRKTNVYSDPVPTKPFSARISEAADALITSLAAEETVSRTVVVKALLTVGARHLTEVRTYIRDQKKAA